MEKQRQDNKRRMTYGSRVPFESDTIPVFIKQAGTKEGTDGYSLPVFWILSKETQENKSK